MLTMGLPAFSQATDTVLPADVLPRLDAVHPAWQSFEPSFQPTICPFTGRRDYDASRFRCGYVLVPEDRADRTSRLIKLSVVQVTSSTEPPATTAMVYLEGGPGGPSLGGHRLSRFESQSNRILLDAMDLVFFDQRGIGYSDGDFCRAVPQPYQYGVPAATDGTERFAEDLQRCFEEAEARGMAIDGYTNWQNALDVRDIRRALGYDQWNLFAISYGTELAQGVMQVDREGTRAVVLDSVVPAGYTTNDMDGMFAAGFRSALDAVNGMCVDDPACRRAYPDLADRFVDVIEAYEADPLVIEGLGPHAAANGVIVLDGTTIGGAVFQALYRDAVYGDLPGLLRALETRNEGALSAYVEALGYPIDHSYGMGMSATINCRAGFREEPTAPAPEGDGGERLAPFVSTVGRDRVCARFFPNTPDPTVTPSVSDIPVLLAAGEADPITPPYYADLMADRLSSLQRVDVPHTGHGAILSHWRPCGQRVVRDFFIDPAAPTDVSCLTDTPAPEFLVSFRETSRPYAFGLQLQAGQYPWLVAGAAGIIALVLAGFPLGAAARRIDGVNSGDYGGARLLLWLGGAASLGALYLGIRTILDTATNHFATLPVGVPSTIAWAGWLGLLGAGLGAAAVIQLIRAPSTPDRTIGTCIAILAGAAGTIIVLWFLFSIDAGPIVL